MGDKCVAKMLVSAIILAVLAIVSADDRENHPNRRSYYVCPPNFMRLGNKCYFFSNATATWQEAYFHCKDLRSNLAVIKSAHQNKILRTALNKESVEPVERWVGGYFDWQQKEWKWAPSGKPMHFQGFSEPTSEENKMDWQKAILDPSLQYKWSARGAFEQKHYICMTNLKNVSHKEKRKLRKIYKANGQNDLNAIPVPNINDPSSNLPNDIDPNAPLELTNRNHPLHFEADIIGQADFAKRSKEERIRRKKLREEAKRKREQNKKKRNHSKHINSTLDDSVDTKSIKRKRNRRKENGKHKQEKSTEIPLHPQKIVEDLSDWKFNSVHTFDESVKST